MVAYDRVEFIGEKTSGRTDKQGSVVTLAQSGYIEQLGTPQKISTSLLTAWTYSFLFSLWGREGVEHNME